MSLGPDFEIKRNATLPTLKTYALDSKGNQIDLSTATSCLFSMADPSGTKIVDRVAGTVDTTNNQLVYTWRAADTATSGNFRGEFKVTFPSGQMDVPTEGFISILIWPDLP